MHLVGFTIEIYYDARPYERPTFLHFIIVCYANVFLLKGLQKGRRKLGVRNMVYDDIALKIFLF